MLNFDLFHNQFGPIGACTGCHELHENEFNGLGRLDANADSEFIIVNDFRSVDGFICNNLVVIASTSSHCIFKDWSNVINELLTGVGCIRFVDVITGNPEYTAFKVEEQAADIDSGNLY